MKTIVFFGDSNTWGYNPATKGRFPLDVRFTGLLSSRLLSCRIIEEGLKGRTNALDDPLDPGRNGSRSLPLILCTHDPIDVLVIMLGTNDTKRMFNQSPYEIGRALENNIRTALSPQLWDGCQAPRILVVCPPGVTEDFEGDEMAGMFDKSSVERSILLDAEYRRVADKYGCEYLNAREVTGPGRRDGVHLDAEGHRRLAGALEKKLLTMI